MIKNKTCWDILKYLVQFLVAKLVGQCIGNWHGNCTVTTILKLGWDFGPGAVCDAVGAGKLVDVLVIGGIVIANCVYVSFGSHNFMTSKIKW